MKTLNCIVAILAFAFVSFGSVVPVDAQGRWIGQENVDDFSGETSYTAVQSDSGVTLSIGCMEGGATAVLLALSNGLACDGSFQYRLDDSDVTDAEWVDGNRFIAIQGAGAVAFIREISDGRELRVRIPRFNRGRVNATFNLDGVAPHVSEVERLCDDW